MQVFGLTLAATGAVALGASTLASNAQPAKSAAAVQAETQRRDQLKPAAAFASITDPDARSVALFQEMGKVIPHPRCMNCHPASTPIQGDAGRRRIPLVVRGEDGHCAKASPCASCHTAQNVDVTGERIRSAPGHPQWRLAPKGGAGLDQLHQKAAELALLL